MKNSYKNNLEFVQNEQKPTPYGIVPLAFEVKDVSAHRFLDGDQAFIRTGRSPVVEAIREFEKNNPLFSQHIFDENGSFVDKDFVKFGYNDYMALSHLHELESYVEKLEPVANHVIADREKLCKELPDFNIKVPTKTEALLPYLAQIHLAKASHMVPDRLEFMVDYMTKHPDAGEEKMGLMRDSFLNGETIPEVARYIDKPVAIIDALKQVKPYVKKEEYEVLMKSNDPETIRSLSFAFEYDKMNLDVGAAIVDFSNKLNQNSELLQALPYWYRTDGKTEVFVQLNKEHKLNPKEVEFLGKSVLNSGKSINYEQAEAKLGALRNLTIDHKTAWKPVSKIRDNDIKKENHREKDTMEK